MTLSLVLSSQELEHEHDPVTSVVLTLEHDPVTSVVLTLEHDPVKCCPHTRT